MRTMKDQGPNLRSSLSAWLAHRETLLGLKSHDDLAEAACIPRRSLDAMIERGMHSRIGRSARAYLARALEVTVRDLEDLAAGKIDWISDSRRVDWKRVTPDCLRIARAQTPLDVTTAVACAIDRGIPIVGRISANGTAEFLHDPSQDIPRLPLRIAGAPDAFALTVTAALAGVPAGAAILFKGLPPGELRHGELALVTIADGDERSLFCHVEHDKDLRLRLISPMGEPGPMVPMESIVRAARAIGIHADNASRGMV